ncbi:MAG: AMP-binding protein [Nitrospirota bacterium]
MADTIPALFRLSAERFSDRRAFHYFSGSSWETMSYAEFFALSERSAAFLSLQGLRRGDRAAIIAENGPGWCAAYLAIVRCGGIAVPIDMQLGSGEIRNLLLDSEAKAILCSDKTAATIRAATDAVAIKIFNIDTAPWRHGETEQQTDEPALRCSVAPDDIASIIYTSGTTGMPKGVVLTHQNFCSDADAVIRAGVVTHNDNVLSVLPLHHTYPFMCTFLVPLLLGASVTFSPGLKAADLRAAIKDNGVTVVVGVPRLFESIRNGVIAKIKERGVISGTLLALMRLCGRVRRSTGLNVGKLVFASLHRNFPNVRFFASGGARLEPSLMHDLEALGFTMVEGYGLSEAAPVITFNPPEKRKPGSVGKPLPGVEIRISGEGEIMVKGPMVMKGYYRNPAATDAVIQDGWLLTGDLGYLDREGYLFITGRKKEVIVLSSGKNIYPEDVENAYSAIPLIKELCIVGSERSGVIDAIHAVIVPNLDYAKRESIGNITEALSWSIKEVSAKLPHYMRIQGFTLFSEPLPRTPLGKLRRFMVRDLVKRREKEPQPERKADETLLHDEIGRSVVNSIVALMDEKVPVRSTDSLEVDLGFDSLKKIELISALEHAFSIDIPDTFITGAQTVGDIVAALRAHHGEVTGGVREPVSWKDILEKEPSPSDRQKMAVDYSPVELAVVRVLLMILKVLFRIVFRLEVKGAGHIPDAGPFVIAPNHASYLDGFVVAAALPFGTFKKLYFLGLQKFFAGWFTSRFARLAHVIPIDAEVYLTKALQLSAYLIRNNRSLCIFPEGGRSYTGELLPFKKGVGVLALETGVPVVPAYIKGTYEALPRGSRWIRPARITVIFGEPVTAGRREEGADRYQIFADRVRQRVMGLSND